jgi:hypothetical protein
VKIPCELATDPSKMKEGYYSFSCPPPPVVQEAKADIKPPSLS